MALTQSEIAAQMIAQLQALDPAASAEVGTPERMILDTVAGSIADSQIDLTVLQGALELESKFGSNLDRFVALFGFARQDPAFAVGFVTFSRVTPSSLDIIIPADVRVQATLEDRDVIFASSFTARLVAGQTSITVPVRAVVAGIDGNVAAGSITEQVNDVVIGITNVTNETPTSGGTNAETDAELKVRFRNTIFRNLAGTNDQYLALAASNAEIRKANVVGPISRYTEYIQVPEVDDTEGYDIDGDTILEFGNGLNPGEYTSALSSIPYSKYIYTETPTFVSNGQNGPSAVFYRRDIDYRINLTSVDKNGGDTFRLWNIGRGLNPTSETATTYQPNVTFTNVYNGPEGGVEAIRPSEVVLFEHSYMSTASRNDLDRNITNCVDLYVDSAGITQSTTVMPRPPSNFIVNNPASKHHYDNYRRAGEPEHRPVVGNILTPLVYQPVIDLPDTLEVQATSGTFTFLKDVHYWLVEDVTLLGGTIRSRSGIEWNKNLPAVSGSTELYITDGSIDSVAVEGYSYDNTIADLQLILEDSKQVTTDVLVHRSKRRYFKFDITIMYNPGFSVIEANNIIASQVQRAFAANYFGSTIQLSDLLQTIHSVPHVDNVRWTSDVPGLQDLNRLQETDRYGRPLQNVLVEVQRPGVSGLNALSEVQQITITGSPSAGRYALRYEDIWTTALAWNADAATVLAALVATGAAITTLIGTGSPADPFIVTFTGTGPRPLIEATPVPANIVAVGAVTSLDGSRNLSGSEYVINKDFFLKDDELPSLAIEIDETTPGAQPDTVPGMIIRPRAQNTWYK